jgi:hypothetical protein
VEWDGTVPPIDEVNPPQTAPPVEPKVNHKPGGKEDSAITPEAIRKPAGDGDGDGGYGTARAAYELGEAESTYYSHTEGASTSTPAQSDTRDYVSAHHGGARARATLGGQRSKPGWHAKHASWIVENAVSRRKSQKKVNRWMAEVEAVHEHSLKTQKLKAKWNKLTAAQRHAVIKYTDSQMSPADRENRERQAKVHAAFVSKGKPKPKNIDVHVTNRVNPLHKLHGPLPAGWHVGVNRGVHYYWNDSGAKQLHLPSAPFMSQFYNTPESAMSSKQLKAAMHKAMSSQLKLNNVNQTHNDGEKIL